MVSRDSFSDRICEPVPESYYVVEPISGTWTLQKIMTVTSAPLFIITTLVCLWLAAMHVKHYANPHVQRQLVRVIFVPFGFSICGFFSVWFYNASEYLVPVADLYESFALVAFFYYMIIVVTPDEKNRLQFFLELERRGRKGKVIPGGSLGWYSKRWMMVFQLLPGRIIATLATWVVVAKFCPTNKAYRVALVVIQVVNGIQTAICLVGLLQVYRRLREYLQGTKVLKRFLTLKVIVFTQLVQKIVFSALMSNEAVKPSTYVSHMDWAHGIPEFATVCEMFLFCFLFIVPFGWKAFKAEKNANKAVKHLSFFRALIDVLNIFDILSGLFYPLKIRKFAKQKIATPPSAESLAAYPTSYPPPQVEERQPLAVVV